MRCQSDRALEQESSAHLDCEDSELWRLIRLANRVSGFRKSVIGNPFLGNHSQTKSDDGNQTGDPAAATGSTTSVIRNPYLPSTMTTSPWASTRPSSRGSPGESRVLARSE